MIRNTTETLFRLDMLNNKFQKLAYQQSTGKKLQYGSDDANLHTRIIHVDDRIMTYEGLKTQITKTTAQNNSADSTLKESKKLVDFVKQEVLKGLTDTTDDEARKAIAVNLEGVKKNLFNLSNESIEGEYLFTGSNTSIQPFSQDSNGKVTYNGDGYLRKVAVEDGSYRERGVTGFDTFMYTSNTATKGQDLEFGSAQRIVDQGGNEWKMGQVTPATTAGNTITFDASQPLVDENGKTWTLNTAIPQLEDGSGNTIPATLNTGTTYDVVVPAAPATSTLGTAQMVKYDRDGNATNETLAVTKGTDQAFKVSLPASADGMRLEAKTSIFDTMDKIINALNKLDSDGNPISAADAKKALGAGNEEIQKAFEGMNVGHAELGGRNKVFEISLERVESKLTQYNIVSQEIGAADLTEVAVKAKALELTFTSLYSTINKMNELSLVNFIR